MVFLLIGAAHFLCGFLRRPHYIFMAPDFSRRGNAERPYKMSAGESIGSEKAIEPGKDIDKCVLVRIVLSENENQFLP